MTRYKSKRIVDGELKWTVIENGIVIDRNPKKDELQSLKVEHRKRYERYTNEELLNYLVKFHEKNGKIPKASDFVNNSEYPSFVTYQKHFGNWNNGLILAKLGIREKDKIYTNEELLDYLVIFREENGRVPVTSDFIYNLRYPGYQVYFKRFGSWEKALKLVGMDLDSRVKQGKLVSKQEKGRFVEIIVREMFDNKGIDLSGIYCNNYCDGICPNGEIYDVKSIGFSKEKNRWPFSTRNEDKDDDKEVIQWYYFAAFNHDYTKLIYMWRVPGEIVDKDTFYVGMYNGYEFNIENMKKYDITDEFKKFYEQYTMRKKLDKA